jgi:hypothetical protein
MRRALLAPALGRGGRGRRHTMTGMALITIQGSGYLLPTNLWVCIQLRRPDPDLAKIMRAHRDCAEPMTPTRPNLPSSSRPIGSESSASNRKVVSHGYFRSGSPYARVVSGAGEYWADPQRKAANDGSTLGVIRYGQLVRDRCRLLHWPSLVREALPCRCRWPFGLAPVRRYGPGA